MAELLIILQYKKKGEGDAIYMEGWMGGGGGGALYKQVMTQLLGVGVGGGGDMWKASQ